MPQARVLEGRNVLLTGASAGLGLHFAHTLAQAGAKLALGARRVERLDELSAELRKDGAQVESVALDVTDAKSVVAAIDKAEKALGPLDVLVNNAGVASPKWIVDTTEADYDMIMDTNAKGAWLVAQEVGRRMIARKKGGQIVNIASMGGLVPSRHLGAYGMSKAAAIHMTKVMALEWARHGINVNAICPGYVSTEMNGEFFASEEGKKFVATFLRRRLMEPQDLDGPLLMLASAASRAMTGSIIACDDGQGFTLY
ncbi:MAG: SDR family NAD(P)-dependent oxidoreductase [Alphaproteobacteria bacterium]|nr:SDR family NAD(P)-dependent oxidoreductase [Alphaproteobacteria bacterium]